MKMAMLGRETPVKSLHTSNDFKGTRSLKALRTTRGNYRMKNIRSTFLSSPLSRRSKSRPLGQGVRKARVRSEKVRVKTGKVPQEWPSPRALAQRKSCNLKRNSKKRSGGSSRKVGSKDKKAWRGSLCPNITEKKILMIGKTGWKWTWIG